MPLPTQKHRPTLDVTEAKVLLYGPPKVGKTTLVTSLDPDKTLLVATEPGYGAVSGYVQPVSSWQEFLQTGAELVRGNHPFELVAIDTVDLLAKMCQDHVAKRLGVEHPSDLSYGKGWELVANEFRLKLTKLANSGFGVWLVSHAQLAEQVGPGGVRRTIWQPTLATQARRFVVGWADYIFFATTLESEDGAERVLRTKPSPAWEAGARGRPGVELPDPLPMDPGVVRAALARYASEVAGDRADAGE